MAFLLSFTFHTEQEYGLPIIRHHRRSDPAPAFCFKQSGHLAAENFRHHSGRHIDAEFASLLALQEKCSHPVVIRAAPKELKEKYGYTYKIQIDGSCNPKTYKRMYDAGAEVLIVGSSGLFGLNEDLNKACDQMFEDFNRAIAE